MNYGIVLSSGNDVDFMIHGLFKYSFFGHEVWITTSHVCVLIVILVLVGFAIAANIAMKKAQEIPTGFQNVVELIVEKLMVWYREPWVSTPISLEITLERCLSLSCSAICRDFWDCVLPQQTTV